MKVVYNTDIVFKLGRSPDLETRPILEHNVSWVLEWQALKYKIKNEKYEKWVQLKAEILASFGEINHAFHCKSFFGPKSQVLGQIFFCFLTSWHPLASIFITQLSLIKHQNSMEIRRTQSQNNLGDHHSNEVSLTRSDSDER